MIRMTAVVTLFPALQETELVSWIERRWVEPEPDGAGGWAFHEIDVARVRLIYDLRRDMAVGEDVLPLVLSLLDQVYELRARMKVVAGAIGRQPDDVRRSIQRLIGDHLD